jgi:predicted transglutaminase-like cysteine proteinase
MSILERARLCCAVVLACGLAIVIMPGDLMAGTSSPMQAEDAAARQEPFGLPVATMPEGELTGKWRGVERQRDDEALALALCAESATRCTPEAARFLGMVEDARAREGRARLGEVNRAFNLAIRSASDLSLYGAEDVWRTPLAVLAIGAGDCEDYAIAKFVALRVAGVASEDLRVVILRDTVRHEDHAVATARLDGRWFVLDNRRMAMVEDIHMRNVKPLFVMDRSGIRQYLDAPLLANTSPPTADFDAEAALAFNAR